jgi:hypothetical protein
MAMVANGNLRGAGDTIPGMVSTFMTLAVLTVTISYVLAMPLQMGSRGVWLGIAAGMVLDGLFMGWRWRSNIWMRIALQKSAVYRQHLKNLSQAAQERYLEDVRARFMFLDGTKEQVDDEVVRYMGPKCNVAITFADDEYTVTRNPQPII